MSAPRAARNGPKPSARTQLRDSLLELIGAGHTEEALRTLARLSAEAQTYWANKQLAEGVLAGLPEELWQKSRSAAEVFAAVFCRARKAAELMRLYGHWSPIGSPPGVALYAAWALTLGGQAGAALELLEPLEGQFAGAEKGTLLRFKAEALASVGDEGWRAVFAQARGHLSLGALGRCLLEEGNQYYRHGQLAEARGRWAEALAYVRDDPFYSAWLRHSLGITVLAQNPLEAESHLLVAEALSHRQGAREFRARAMCGLGAVRRRLGEWERAVSAYNAALKAATDADDRREALWGIGFTLRLSSKPAEAIPYFMQAHAATASSAQFIEIAAAKLMLGSTDGAEAALGQAQTLDPRDRVKAVLVRAEIARLRGDEDALRHLTAGLDSTSAWVWEEGRCFPKLIALLQEKSEPVRSGLDGLESAHPTVVEVFAGGILRVRVNGREIPLRPSSRAAEFLVLLLEADGEDTLDRLATALFPDMDDTSEARARARQAIWAQLVRLRQVLGWDNSVRAEGGVYRLDPNAEWRYLPNTDAEGDKAFLEGMYSRRWVDRRREHSA